MKSKIIVLVMALGATGCAAGAEDQDFEATGEPSEAPLSRSDISGSAFLSYRITGDIDPPPAASLIASDPARNMDGAGNQCMVPLQRGEGYDDLRAAGVHFGTLAARTGIPVGAFCNTCVDVSLGQVTQRVRVVDSLRDGQDTSDSAGAIHFDLHAATYEVFRAVRAESGKYIRGASFRVVRCGEAPARRRYAVRHYAGGGWYQLQVRHGDVAIESLELVEGGGRILYPSRMDHTGFFNFDSLREGGRYGIRINGALVNDVIQTPTDTSDTVYRANGPWAAYVVKRELVPAGAPGGGAATCSDRPPPGSPQYSCEQQKAWGKCGESWMKGYCGSVCGTCRPVACSNAPPPAAPGQPAYSCEQQKAWGKCGESWMKGYCGSVCGC